ncbi:MAG: hypothetical protein WC438_05985 [Candidatus Pacearchaeota archaeon]
MITNLICPICKISKLIKIEGFFHEMDMSEFNCLQCKNRFLINMNTNKLIQIGTGVTFEIEEE